LEKLGKVFIVTYEGEGHGFRRIENRVRAYKRCAAFLRGYLNPPVGTIN
jgi:dipeptidyl aminopeptidase/acylaminoacyl peptidase